MEYEENVLLDIPAEEYHANKSRVGHSALVKMVRSPVHFLDAISSQEETAALRLGKAVHTAVLEPEIFKSTYKVQPKFDRRTKDGKTAADLWEKENQGCEFISDDEMDGIHGIVSAIATHAGATSMLSKGVFEKTVLWTHEETGILCKIRPDCLVTDDRGEIVAAIDLKTTQNAEKRKFAKSMADYGYDLQAAFYTDGLKKVIGREVPFFFLAVESKAPHGVALYKTGERTIEVGRKKYSDALALLKWCRENQSWPSYQVFGEAEEIDIPFWATKMEYEEDA
jgi:hypothetical protein